MTAHVVTAARDITTIVGTIASGTRLFATLNDSGTWALELSLPRNGVGSRTHTVPADAVVHGSDLPDSIQRRLAAHGDYRFARTVLRYGHTAAMEWLMRSYKVSERTLLRWGFAQYELGRFAS